MTTLDISGKHYDLYTVTGKVNEAGKNMETKVHGGGGGGYNYRGTGGSAPVSITSTTVVHDQIFLTDNSSTEHSFQLQDFNVACRESNELSVIWAIKSGSTTGPYIVVVNHTTRKTFYHDKELKKMFRFNIWYLLAGGMVLGFIMTHGMGGAIPGLLFGWLMWAVTWNSPRLKRFKEEIAAPATASI
ncbi:MAG: hypothetical protein ABI203_12210 [Mucilaginibacter sp.]